jgi:glutaredoxin-like protein NrdH
MKMTHVEGTHKRDLRLYTLSTCIWCKKTKALLKDLDIGYEYMDLDLLDGQNRQEALDALREFNPQCSFPSLVFNNADCIVGFDEQKIKEALKLP